MGTLANDILANFEALLGKHAIAGKTHRELLLDELCITLEHAPLFGLSVKFEVNLIVNARGGEILIGNHDHRPAQDLPQGYWETEVVSLPMDRQAASVLLDRMIIKLINR